MPELLKLSSEEDRQSDLLPGAQHRQSLRGGGAEDLCPTPEAAAPELQAMLASMRLAYRAALPNHLARAREALDRCQAAPEDDGLLREFLRQIHTLAGSAPTFGLVEVGERSRHLEHLLDLLLARSGRTPAQFQPLVALLDRLTDQ